MRYYQCFDNVVTLWQYTTVPVLKIYSFLVSRFIVGTNNQQKSCHTYSKAPSFGFGRGGSERWTIE